MHAHNRIPGGLLAVVLAGPIFFAALAAAAAAEMMPGPVAFTAEEVAAYILVSLFGIFVGAIIALLPVVLGSFAMSVLGNHFAPARHWLVWTIAGGTMGAALPYLLDRDVNAAPTQFAMVVTGALCARIARCWVGWTPGDQLDRKALTPAVAISACPPK
jgi:hypothetical protein